MAIYLTDIRTRIDNELNLLGSFENAVKDEYVKDALSQFCRIVEPEIQVTLTIYAGIIYYSVPSIISKITGIFNSSYQEIVYTLDSYARRITLQDAPEVNTSYIVYGTPADVRTNYDTVIASINENYIDCLWAYVQYAAHIANNSNQADAFFQKARILAKECRQDRNRDPDAYSQMLQLKDIQGNRIDDLYNADNINPDIDDLFEVRL